MLNLISFRGIPQNLGIRQDHPPEASTIRPPLAHRGLRDVRQKILQIAVRRPHKNQIRKSLFQFPRDLHVLRHAKQRIFRRLISIRWRIPRRPLNVRIVVRTPRRDVYELNVQFFQQRQEFYRFRQIDLRGVALLHAEPPAIRNEILLNFRNSRSQFSIT